MINIERPLYRNDFLKLLPPNSIGAELGVFKGEFSKEILSVVKPNKLHLIDIWWKKFGEYYPDWGAYTNYGKLGTREAFRLMKENIKENKEKCSIHIGNDQEILLKFPDKYFDWVYLDSSHEYNETKNELHLIRKKIKPCGLITGHDFYPDRNSRHYGVYKAVTEFCLNTPWKIVYIDRHSQWCLKNSLFW
ncbi:MAG: class I SAM-dependent methyltransferase [Mangrovibacterium sp.]